MKHLTPAIILSALLLTQNQAEVITGTSTKNLTGTQTLTDVTIRGGNLTVNNTGSNTITQMVMLGVATTTFNVNNGSLSLDLSVLNSSGSQNNATFNIGNGASLTLTNGTNANQTGQTGMFLGSSTTLHATLGGGSTLNGHLSNNGNTTLKLNSNSTMNGNIIQSGGTLDATLQGSIKGSLTIADTQTTINSTGGLNITGSIIQTNGKLTGNITGMTLEENFIQSGGASNVTFTNGTLKKTITISSNATATLNFSGGSIQDVLAQNSTTNLTASNGATIQSYTGSQGENTINLSGQSKFESLITQTGGSLTINANNSSTKSIVANTGTAFSVTIDQNTTIDGSIIGNNTQSTNIASTSSKINGNITQTGGVFQGTLQNTTIEGNYTQVGGTLQSFSATNSTIAQGISLSGISANGDTQLMLNHTTITQGGIQIKNLVDHLYGQITNSSTINGGFEQFNRNSVHLLFNSSTLNGGVNVRDGGGISGGGITEKNSHATALDFQSGSTLDGGVTANNHSIWLNFEGRSKAQNGDFNITNGDFYIRGASNSTITGNIISQDTGETRLYLTSSTFDGSITQTNGKQHISMVGKSSITGSINNFNTSSTFANDGESSLKGDYIQDNGTLRILLGGNSVIEGEVTLNNVTTTLSNGTAQIQAATIKGDFTQNGGTLKGTLKGLTLEGRFTQNGGTTNVTFEGANFAQPLEVNNATLSNILFDETSNLKTTTLNNSLNENNTFTLDHTTILEGDFILNHSKVTLGVKNGSKITGNVTSTDPDSDLKFDFEGEGNEIGGDITVSNGNTGGTISGTTIGGDFNLTDTVSHFHIVNSTIRGEFNIVRGSTIMTLDNTTIDNNFTMTGLDKNGGHPTLKLRIGNGSSITGNLSFIDTEAFLGGFGENNSIGNNLIMENSTVTNGGANYLGGSGDPDTIPSMSITGSITQDGGISDLSFTQNSSVGQNIQIQNAKKAHLSFADISTIHALSVKDSLDTIISISNNSSQDNGVNLDSSQATISASNQSTITSDIIITNTNPDQNSEVKVLLNNTSTLTGDIKQNDGGTLQLQYTNNSIMKGTITTENINSLNIALDSSSIEGQFILGKTATQITINNNSAISGDFILIDNPSFILDANNSTLTSSINHSGTPADGYEIILNFANDSVFNNPSTTITGNMQITSKDSHIVSEDVSLLAGKFDLSLNHSTGSIKQLSTGGSNTISISATNSTDFTINTLGIKDSANLSILAQESSVLNSEITLQKASNTTITSLSNANIKANITPENTVSLEIALNGGILQGVINQKQPQTGRMTLGTNGRYGGRWIATDSSAIQAIMISNSSANIGDRSLMQTDSFNTPISLIDTTLNADNSSRVGLSMIASGDPEENQTLVRTIQTNSISGINGVFRLYTDIGAEMSDKITASSASGNHVIQAYYNPATYSSDIGDRYIVLAHVDDPKTTVNFEGGEVDVGTQTYQTSLTKVTSKTGNGFDWILGSTQSLGASYTTKVIASILQSQFRSYAIQTESLRQRMGELRDINRVHGLWGRYSMGSNFTPESNVAIEITDNYYTAWIGYDQNVLDLKGQDFYGLAFSYSYVAPQGEDYQGQIHNFGINLYNTFIAHNDFYVDFIFKYILSYANYQIGYYSLTKNTPSYFNHKVMLSGEIGKKFKLSDSKNYFFIQPDAQIIAGYIFGNTLNFTDASQTTIQANLSGDAPVILRTGLTAGYSLNRNSFKADFYAGSSIFYETSTGGRVNLDDGYNDVSYSYKGDFKMSIQGGFELIFNESSRVYFEAGTNFLGETQATYYINAGARFAFGYKNTRKLKVPSTTPPPPPPKPEYDPRNIPVITDNTTEDIRINNATPKSQGYNSDYFINTRRFYRDKTTVINNPKPTY